MIRRFVSGSAIASLVIACAALAVLVTPGLGAQRFYPVAFVWCFAPLAWGLWAAFAPGKWVPDRLPVWGAVLGLMGGVLVMFGLNVPSRVLGAVVPVIWRAAGVAVAAVGYYFLWMLVRLAYRSLDKPAPMSETPVSAKAA
ncbi:MAG: hypothetical protein ABSB82_06035 [Terriglobia bacterium]|jgi:FtsH-binding integral membrane protein